MNNENRDFDIVHIDLSTCKLSLVFIVVTLGQNKVAHVALVLGEIKCAICMGLFHFRTGKFQQKEKDVD